MGAANVIRIVFKSTGTGCTSIMSFAVSITNTDGTLLRLCKTTQVVDGVACTCVNVLSKEAGVERHEPSSKTSTSPSEGAMSTTGSPRILSTIWDMIPPDWLNCWTNDSRTVSRSKIELPEFTTASEKNQVFL